jgi:hypothetical protein
MKQLYSFPMLACAVFVISSTAQADTLAQTQAHTQNTATVCKSNVQQLQQVVDGMDAQRGSQKHEAQTALLGAKAQGDAGKYEECISLASNALNKLGIPPTAKGAASAR